MGGVMGGSGSKARRAEMQAAAAEQAELANQKKIAEAQLISAKQDTLTSETDRLARLFGNRALMSGLSTQGVRAA